MGSVRMGAHCFRAWQLWHLAVDLGVLCVVVSKRSQEVRVTVVYKLFEPEGQLLVNARVLLERLSTAASPRDRKRSNERGKEQEQEAAC